MWIRSVISLFATLAISLANNIPPVSELNLEKYMGHWYQVYAAPVDFTFQGYGKCITADYAIQSENNVSVLNMQLNKNDELEQISGFAFYKDLSEPGQLSVHLDGVPVISPYWIVKVGEHADEYKYSVVSVPTGSSLWVLARNVSEFFEIDDAEVSDFLDAYSQIYVKVNHDDCPLEY